MGTGPLLVPKSNVIPGNPRLSVPWRGGIQRATVPLSRAKNGASHAQSHPRIAQETAGSSPASSIRGTPAAAGVPQFRPPIGASEFWLREPRNAAKRAETPGIPADLAGEM